jgi:hypothetical protein
MTEPHDPYGSYGSVTTSICTTRAGTSSTIGPSEHSVGQNQNRAARVVGRPTISVLSLARGFVACASASPGGSPARATAQW